MLESGCIIGTDWIILDVVGSDVPKRVPYNNFITSGSGYCGYSHTGAFAGKPLSNNYVWEAGQGINYTQTDVDNDLYKVLSLDNAVHLAVDNPQ